MTIQEMAKERTKYRRRYGSSDPMTSLTRKLVRLEDKAIREYYDKERELEIKIGTDLLREAFGEEFIEGVGNLGFEINPCFSNRTVSWVFSRPSDHEDTYLSFECASWSGGCHVCIHKFFPKPTKIWYTNRAETHRPDVTLPEGYTWEKEWWRAMTTEWKNWTYFAPETPEALLKLLAELVKVLDAPAKLVKKTR